MNEILKYLQRCGTFYLATNESDQPRVRPFGAACEFEGKLYLTTNNQKNVYKQLLKNPKIEISGMLDGTWLRLEAEAVHDPSRDARAKMLADNESLGNMYSIDDGLMEVLYLKNATATICSFTDQPKVTHF